MLRYDGEEPDDLSLSEVASGSSLSMIVLEGAMGGAIVTVTGGRSCIERLPSFWWCSTVARYEFLRISVRMYSILQEWNVGEEVYSIIPCPYCTGT
jgi:hypothetical protein